MDDVAALLGPVTVNVPSGLTDEDQATIIDWTWAHGIDPHSVPLPAPITFENGQVTFELIVLDADGHPVWRRGDVERYNVTVPQVKSWPFEGSPRPMGADRG